ncbi:lactosylceramide 1,3-N-acetyl-beta-D-glucosaminyltransferase-like [Teleopsis dalmanni]|uniref:lactosylceramide 1,3-N-acetyl-beta-D-glucosaminyltransferase-like n=1 Tax=Teleopsis dalmanni TaxID=139649 RepID=UPI0018CE5306|nr:lactosylceramide 1,3-N-acetyl-beta-D-glucosaminyltransferase-like [Teleopsis dalmanni]
MKSLYLIDSKRISANITNYTPKPVNLTSLQYLLQSNHCQKYKKEFLAIIMIKSAANNTMKRMSHRQSKSQKELANLGLQRIFLLGEVAPMMSNINQTTLQLEHDTYGDLVQGSFQDTYQNLSYKMWMGLDWTSSECKNAKFIINMDDDVVYDIYYIINYLKNFFRISLKLAISDELLIGQVLTNKASRNTKFKWYVTHDEYAKDSYPLYVAGWFYITNPLTAARLAKEAIQTPFFWIDDIWMTGIVRERLQIPLQTIYSWFTYKNSQLKRCIEDVKEFQYFCDYKVGPNNKEPNFLYIYQNYMKICSEGKCKQRPAAITPNA